VPEVRRTDEKLANLVAAALVGDAATEVYEINVQAQDGVVTLTGVVDFWHEEQLAIKVAAGVSGFRGINSEIDIDYDTNRPDDEIKAEIRTRHIMIRE
jgi:osmotically-inducible protein OsmY